MDAIFWYRYWLNALRRGGPPTREAALTVPLLDQLRDKHASARSAAEPVLTGSAESGGPMTAADLAARRAGRSAAPRSRRRLPAGVAPAKDVMAWERRRGPRGSHPATPGRGPTRRSTGGRPTNCCSPAPAAGLCAPEPSSGPQRCGCVPVVYRGAGGCPLAASAKWRLTRRCYLVAPTGFEPALLP